MKMEDELKHWSKARVSSERFLHSLGVLEAATELARRHGVDETPLRQAALLRLRPGVFNDELVATAEEWGILVRDVDRGSPVLLHGKSPMENSSAGPGADRPNC